MPRSSDSEEKKTVDYKHDAIVLLKTLAKNYIKEAIQKPAAEIEITPEHIKNIEKKFNSVIATMISKIEDGISNENVGSLMENYIIPGINSMIISCNNTLQEVKCKGCQTQKKMCTNLIFTRSKKIYHFNICRTCRKEIFLDKNILNNPEDATILKGKYTLCGFESYAQQLYPEQYMKKQSMRSNDDD